MSRHLGRLLPASFCVFCAVMISFCISISARADTILVSDTWQDGTRTDPGAPTYTAFGTNGGNDGDGSDVESTWYVNSPNLTVAPGHMTITPPSSSQNWTTYFTPNATPITLANAGDFLKVTWVFTPSGVNTSNTSQNLPFTVANTPSSALLTADGAPGNANYTGYAMYTNMGQTLGNSHPFQLRSRITANNPTSLLNSSSNWTALADGANNGNHGYDSGTQYTMTWLMTRGASNDLIIDVKMQGGTLNNSGTAEVVNFDDTAPNTFSFNTFNVRPASNTGTATSFDFNSFTVTTNVAVPEPASLLLLVLGGSALGVIGLRRTKGSV